MDLSEINVQIRKLQGELAGRLQITHDADDHVYLSWIYESLSDLFLARSELEDGGDSRAQAREYLVRAVSACTTGATMAPADHHQKGNFWARAAQLSASAFESFGQEDDITAAIGSYDNALKYFDPGSQDYASVLANQANHFTLRFERAQRPDVDDLNAAIFKAELARGMFAQAGSGALLPAVDNALSTMYLNRFESTGQSSDLNKAEELAREVVENSSPDSQPDLAIWKLNWGNCLRRKFDANNDNRALEKAIEQLQEANDLARDKEGLPRDKILSVLSGLLFARYEAYKTSSDLVDSIQVAQEALEQANRETIGVILSNLAAFTHAYHERSHDLQDLDKAIDIARASLEYLEDDWPHRTMCLANLANMLGERFRIKKAGDSHADFQDLDEALGHLTFPTGPSNISSNSLAILHDVASRLLMERYESGAPPDGSLLDQAISHCHSAIAAVGGARSDTSRYQLQLGDALKMKHGHEPTPDNFEAAVNAYRNCLGRVSASPWHRVVAGHRAGLMYESMGQWANAYGALAASVALMPDLVLASLERDSQLYALSGLSGLSNLASSMALQAGEPAAVAFKSLEAGRGIMADLALGSPLAAVPANLDNAGRETWRRIVELQRQIQQPLQTGWFSEGYTEPSSGQISERVRLLSEYQDKAQQLKELHGHDVSRPVSEERLKQLASHGAVVAFVSSTTRSDALILTEHGVDQLPLHHLTFEEAAKHVAFLTRPMENGMRNLGFENYYEVNEGMKSLLSWLWDKAVRPVLEHLKIYTNQHVPPRSVLDLPRIYWITSGALGLMPFHAAGRHSPRSTENAVSHVISSYATSTRSLAWALEHGKLKSSTTSDDPIGAALVVGMPTTPGLAAFSLIPRHLDALRPLVPLPNNLTYKESPSSAEIVSKLPHINTAHFICHGVTVLSDASSSSLLLQDVNDTEKVDPLMVRTLASLPLFKARLAFLAACRTADNTQLDVLEEGLHLVGAFQMVGFVDVIGTMWEAEEGAAAEVAEGFYRVLGRKDERDVACAWYEAVMALRGKDTEDVVTWAPFVHFGR